MRFFYDVSFLLFSIIYLPYLIITRRYSYGIKDRFGILSNTIRNISAQGKKVIWLHGVSVGEIKSVSLLAPLLRNAFPSHTLIFSTITHTGNKVARTIATGEEEIFYLPYDVSFITDRVVRIIKPELFLCLETELWPNLILSLYKFNTKIVLVNGRISDKSYFGYRKIRFITHQILNKFSLILMQSERYKERILGLGAHRDKVFVTGNLKFDLSFVVLSTTSLEIRGRLNIRHQDVLLVAGSTHRGEEEQIVYCFSRLRKDYPNLILFIAPRHIERVSEIEKLLDSYGFNPVRYSSIGSSNSDRVFILDTIGELKTIYSAGDIVFVGGSLVRKGGQNPIEPAGLEKPVIIGPNTSNFQDVINSFLEDKSCIQVQDRDELYSALKFLLDNPNERRRLGMCAKETVRRNSGSSQKTIELIKSALKKSLPNTKR